MVDYYFMPISMISYAGSQLRQIISRLADHECVPEVHPFLKYRFGDIVSPLLYAPIIKKEPITYPQRLQTLMRRLLSSTTSSTKPVDLPADCCLLLLIPDNKQWRSKAFLSLQQQVKERFSQVHTVTNQADLFRYHQQQNIIVLAIDSLIHNLTIHKLARQGLLQTQANPEGIALSEAAICLWLSRDKQHAQQKRLYYCNDEHDWPRLLKQTKKPLAKIITHFSLRSRLFKLLNFQRYYFPNKTVQTINIAEGIGEVAGLDFLMTLSVAHYYARPGQYQLCLELDHNQIAIVH